MIRALPLLALLAACAQTPAQPLNPVGYAPLDHEAPFALRALLPRGTPTTALRENDGCYAYLFRDSLLYPVRRPDGGQYCIGTGE
ncbi:hypothetical protein JQC91_14665 [Jannaschia sp. Os4]|uniref:hypothetical protein n=1 Tax=Jannaschia sp. Os4 TaxID=2807617 RepID=UPI001939C0EC|nr:hypothetical protein [Jannaschia sp. Os4]MBM2577548.1 hypothetical protein [Jannaschia sp. Os4]